MCLTSDVSAQSLDLASDLMAEGNWRGARRESLRVLSAQPDHEGALLLAALAELRLGRFDSNGAVRVLAHLSAEAGDDAVRLLATYEYARTCWMAGDLAAAWSGFSGVFQQAKGRDLFLRSGCALFLLLQADDRLGRENPALLSQLAACRDLWTRDVQDEVRGPAPGRKSRPAAQPAGWIVSFYRSQIGPAIGHRCSLAPSCSTYFLEASRDHGWLGVPLIADRLVREPGVVSAAERPVLRGEELRYLDPVADHVRATGRGGQAP